MTSIQLADMCSGYRWFRDRKIQITPGEVYAAGSLAQNKICTELEIVEAKGEVSLVASTEEYTLPASVVNIKGEKLLYVASDGSTRELKKRTINEVNFNRNNFSAGNVRFWYARSENQLVIGFQGIPNVAATVVYPYYRKPLSSEALSASVNPIMDSNYDMLLYWYTVRQILSIYKSENGAKQELANIEGFCQEERREALAKKTRRAYVSEVDYENVRW